MGIFDSLVGSLLGGGANQGALGSIIGAVLNGQGTGNNGLGGLVERLNQAGLGNVAQSWVGNGPNQPISPGSLGEVLNRDQVNQWAQQAGMSPDGLLGALAKLLPHAVDHVTPDGKLPPAGTAFDEAGMEPSPTG